MRDNEMSDFSTLKVLVNGQNIYIWVIGWVVNSEVCLEVSVSNTACAI